jgi:hypothetical protein
LYGKAIGGGDNSVNFVRILWENFEALP